MKIFIYDFAREQSWCAPYWRRILPDLRRLGYDHLMLYVEQRYHFRTLPQHRPHGGLTPAQADEALRLCKRFGLTLVWVTNVLGHCNGLLENPAFHHLAEDMSEGEQLCPSHPQTRPFLRTMLREFARMSPGNLLGIGADEARALNRCPRCRRRNLSDGELYLDHINWVIRYVNQLGKRPAMAGDMLLKFPHLIPRLDKRVIIKDWHYDSGSEETLRLFQQHGFDVIATTSSNEYWRTMYPFDQVKTAIAPFMSEAKRLGCAGIAMGGWELHRGTHMDNHWEHNAAAVATFQGKSLNGFAENFYGSSGADYQRLRRLFDERELAKLNPALATPLLRRQFGNTESGFLFYHTFRESSLRDALGKLARRIAPARRIVRDIRASATRRKAYLDLLDLPLDLLEVMHDRIETLAAVRDAADRLHPHRLPAQAGSRLLRTVVRRLSRHIARCDKLAARYDDLVRTRGGSEVDPLRLRRQLGQLRTLHRYITYHANTYSKGTAVPPHELWYV